jgi:hypothetical protein
VVRQVIEGFQFENLERGHGEAGGEGPESIHAFIDACRGREYYDGRAVGLLSSRIASDPPLKGIHVLSSLEGSWG